MGSMDWINLPQHMGSWRAIAIAVMDLCVP